MLCWLKSHVSWKGMDPESVKCLEYFSLFPQCSQSVLKFFYNPTYPLRHLMRPIFGSKWDNLIYLPPPLFFPGDSALVSKRVNKGFSLNGQGLLIWSRSSKSIWATTDKKFVFFKNFSLFVTPYFVSFRYDSIDQNIYPRGSTQSLLKQFFNL